jgi:hypothetical protein
MTLSDYKTDKNGIPIYLSSLITYFDKKPEFLKQEGIFRKQGSKQIEIDIEKQLK